MFGTGLELVPKNLIADSRTNKRRKASESKRSEDQEDQKWFVTFWTEWRRLRSIPKPEAQRAAAADR